MTTPQQPDPLSGLASTLSAEYDQSREAQHDRVLAELKQVVEQVPEQTELTNSRRFLIVGPLLIAFSLAGAFVSMQQGKTGMTIGAVVLALLFAFLTWQHRDAGKHPFLRLTRRQLFHDLLSAPVELADVIDIGVHEGGWLLVQNLALDPAAPLPTHRPCKVLFGNQAMALRKPRPHILIQSAGLMVGGQKLQPEDAGALLNAYVMAAKAQRQLDAMR
ncbi:MULTISPECIES: hypothetical protein [unclassified Pseudomonas]|uniref:hypothetical protein n=1 Tax=unclassified Pseudomonas TaxID=196821 RepID=UPI000BD07E8F|nr:MULTISPECIES: hypothetical protein [unclassified Pseudomonas]PVZ10442.1 hypothetical protein F474_04032 [Pseudomonas sp. URIL14HWK12:I12]PVZ21868.1 hypothetical protein F470_04032 [Pseudomonas sp. URIL14HWK12:I10]PVZ31049.1 hypothetical protein F472_04066 [Pseudomonas sp. URIL14HWK12:I11]SNZ17642.1 hypothetical protein SAMN05660463_03705 [Pseudomonas sp. URIL14HWK12:I9]